MVETLHATSLQQLFNLVKGLLDKDFPVPCDTPSEVEVFPVPCSLKTRVSTTITKEPAIFYNVCNIS
jgi:hypothetical protein